LQIQQQLGCTKNPWCYDITAACSGFVSGLLSAACHIRGMNLLFCWLQYPLNVVKFISL